MEQGWNVHGKKYTLLAPQGGALSGPVLEALRRCGIWVYRIQVGFGVGGFADLRNRQQLGGGGGIYIE